jgi:hypothetical protein
MPWTGHDPPATDVILHLRRHRASQRVVLRGGSPARLEIDKLPDGHYRATVGTLFEHQEICRTNDLEALVRQANAMAACRSFDDVVRALQCGRSLRSAYDGRHIGAVGIEHPGARCSSWPPSIHYKRGVPGGGISPGWANGNRFWHAIR